MIIGTAHCSFGKQPLGSKNQHLVIWVERQGSPSPMKGEREKYNGKKKVRKQTRITQCFGEEIEVPFKTIEGEEVSG